MLVANQIAPLSSMDFVILSESFAPGIDLSSSVVRNVLRGWIAHGDAAGVWMTLSFATVLAKPHESTAVCLLEACHQAGRYWLFRGTQQQHHLSGTREVRQQTFCHQIVTAGPWVLLACPSGNEPHWSPSTSLFFWTLFNDATTMVKFAPFLAIRIVNKALL